MYSQAPPVAQLAQVQRPVDRSQVPALEHSASSSWAMSSAVGYWNQLKPYSQVRIEQSPAK